MHYLKLPELINMIERGHVSRYPPPTPHAPGARGAEVGAFFVCQLTSSIPLGYESFFGGGGGFFLLSADEQHLGSEDLFFGGGGACQIPNQENVPRCFSGVQTSICHFAGMG